MIKRFGEILIERGKLDASSLERALRVQETSREERIGNILIKTGMAAERDVMAALSAQFDLPLASATDYPEFPLLEERVSVRFLKHSKALPLREDEGRLLLAMADPLDEYVINAFRLLTHRKVVVLLAAPSELESAFERLYGSGKSSMDQIVDEVETREEQGDREDLQHLKDMASEAPTIRLVSLIINHALEARASDIHIEPFENRLIVRYRVDGVMHESVSPGTTRGILTRQKPASNAPLRSTRSSLRPGITLAVSGVTAGTGKPRSVSTARRSKFRPAIRNP